MTEKQFNWVIPNLNKKRPGRHIQEYIIANITARNLKPGDQLPSYRKLGKLNHISETTVKKAYFALTINDWLSTSPRLRTFVSYNNPEEVMPLRSKGFTERFPAGIQFANKITRQKPNYIIEPFISIGTFTPSHALFPQEIFNKYYSAHQRETLNASQAQYLNSYNKAYLKEEVLNDLNRHRDFGIKSGMIEIIKGRRTSLEAVFKILLDKPGAVVINTSFYDPVLTHVLNNQGADIYGVNPSDAKFLSNLQRILKSKTVRFIYVQTPSSFPDGNTLTRSTRQKLVAMAVKYNTCIIEEDKNHEYYYGELPYKPLACHEHVGHVVYIGVLSLATSYAQTIHVVVASVQLINTLKLITNQSVDPREVIMENALADMIANGHLATYQKHSRLKAKENRYSLDFTLSNYLGKYISYELPEHGFTFWIKFRDDINLNDLLEEIERRGIEIPYHPTALKPEGKVNYMLLGFGHYQAEEAEAAAKEMQDVLKALP
nr:PLP-dependent aminotransferase family protein [Pedobacter panaciterrae]